MLGAVQYSRVFLVCLLEILSCGNTGLVKYISVNGLWKLYLDYADMHFFPLLGLEKYSYVN